MTRFFYLHRNWKAHTQEPQLTKARSSLRQPGGQVLGLPQHIPSIPSPHEWAEECLQAGTLIEIIS